MKGQILVGGPIEFLSVDVPTDSRIPFAVVHYSIGGVKRRYGLRLDLDKEVFLDHIEDGEHDDAIKKVAWETAQLIRRKRAASKKTSPQ